jgi:hypothetical protein
VEPDNKRLRVRLRMAAHERGLQRASGRVSRVKLARVTELLAVCKASGHFFTEHYYPNEPRPDAGTDEYDAQGVFLRSNRSPLAVYSANCRYAVSFSALAPHGPDDWAVYDANTRTRLITFRWDESWKIDSHWFQAWNPAYDHLLLMHTVRAGNREATIDILDVRRRRVIRSWTDAPDTHIVWSGDGNATVTVRDNRIIFEPLAVPGIEPAFPD